jgi:CPA2 family monovalent cation:H+ antiporter-2
MDGHHDFTGIAIVALGAMSCGVLFARLKQPAIVGYILAGVLLGPSALGLVNDRDAIGLLAELGIIMLLFVIGTELSVKRFAEVWRVAMLTTVLQVAGSVGVLLAAKQILGWSTGTAVLLGYAVALSSTAVVIKLLQQTGELETPAGRLTVGVLP